MINMERYVIVRKSDNRVYCIGSDDEFGDLIDKSMLTRAIVYVTSMAAEGDIRYFPSDVRPDLQIRKLTMSVDI